MSDSQTDQRSMAVDLLRRLTENPSEDRDWECVRASDLNDARAFLASLAHDEEQHADD